MKGLKTGIASDHAGFDLKSYIISYFSNIEDYGCNNNLASVDYPDFANKLCSKIFHGEIDRGILICGTGIGVSIAANRFSYIRAALCFNKKMSTLARNHNDANILCLGARMITKENSTKCVESFLNTSFDSGRHEIRVQKLDKISVVT